MPLPVNEIEVGGVYEGATIPHHRNVREIRASQDGVQLVFWTGYHGLSGFQTPSDFAKWATRRIQSEGRGK